MLQRFKKFKMLKFPLAKPLVISLAQKQVKSAYTRVIRLPVYDADQNRPVAYCLDEAIPAEMPVHSDASMRTWRSQRVSPEEDSTARRKLSAADSWRPSFA